MNAWYGEDELFKITQRDENGNSVITYTDKIGRKIMQDQQGSKTYFIYNNQGLLEQVVQPEAAEKGHTTPMLTLISQQIIEGSFLYTYDDEYRMKTKVVPNCAAYTYFYDDLDQLVMTEDGNGFKTFTKYDKLGRPIITGRYKGNSVPTRAGIVFEERSSTAPHYYTTNQSFPSDGNIDIYTVSYHGSADEAWFEIGKTQYYTPSRVSKAKNLKRLGALLAKDGNVILNACHCGSDINGGVELSRARFKDTNKFENTPSYVKVTSNREELTTNRILSSKISCYSLDNFSFFLWYHMGMLEEEMLCD